MTFAEKKNEINSLCHRVLYDYIEKEVNMYRYQLGYHFEFDFKYMLIRQSEPGWEQVFHGKRKRVRCYDLLLKHIWSLPIEDYLHTEKDVYLKYKHEIKKEVDEFDEPEYCILHDPTCEDNEFITFMTKYFQVYIIKNLDTIDECFKANFH